MKFHPGWQVKGDDVVANDIGDGLILVYWLRPNCESDFEDQSADAVFVVRANNADVLYELKGELVTPSVRVIKKIVRRVDRIHGDLGPSKEQSELIGTLRAHHCGDFQRVTAIEDPYENWSRSEASRAYFALFTTIAVAKEADAPPKSGNSPQFVYFPFYKERNSHSDYHYKTYQLTYNGGTFELADEISGANEVWYSAPKGSNGKSSSTDGPVLVSYKGTVVSVNMQREVFDPETKTIWQFIRWTQPAPWEDAQDRISKCK